MMWCCFKSLVNTKQILIIPKGWINVAIDHPPSLSWETFDSLLEVCLISCITLGRARGHKKVSQRLRLLVRGIFLYQYSFLCLRAPKRASYILSECVLEVFNSIGDYWRNRRLCHWKIGIRMKWGHRASGMEILLYSEIYGVGSTAGDFWHNFKIQSCYFITTENICKKNKYFPLT